MIAVLTPTDIGHPAFLLMKEKFLLQGWAIPQTCHLFCRSARAWLKGPEPMVEEAIEELTPPFAVVGRQDRYEEN